MSNLSEAEVGHWRSLYSTSFSKLHGDHVMEEGLWRRTQNEKNRHESGWQSDTDMRRRILHYQHTFSLVEESGDTVSLALTDVYLWWHVCLPQREVSLHEHEIRAGLQCGGWNEVPSCHSETLFCNGDIHFKIKRLRPSENKRDTEQHRIFPDAYEILEVTVSSSENEKSEEFLRKPWDVLATGIRKKGTRGNPRINEWNALEKLFPAQVEVGCGTSVEAGVPPLHFLHDVYGVTDKQTGMFVLYPHQDSLVRSIAEHPHESMSRFSEMHRRCFLARPTRCHILLKQLHQSGHIVGPIITNNFDGLLRGVELPELFVRRYEETHIVPTIQFHPSAKSLLVIGCHADRRKIQAAARQSGLLVAHIDTEGFKRDDGGFTPYPLESPQNADYLFRMTATEAVEKIASALL